MPLTRINGIYPQRQAGYFMLRVKIPGSVISAEQALKLSELGDRFANRTLHLTSRASIEFHWLQREHLEECLRLLGTVGLTSRGACGGAVRGVACSTSLTAPHARNLAARLHHHFTGNQAFEGLPKKFKIGIETDTASGRHLIQDAGLLHAGEREGEACYDVWIAGGLGREPQEGFLLEPQVPEGRIIPLLEAIIRVYRRETPAGKRLKHLARTMGSRELTRRIRTDIDLTYPLARAAGIDLLPNSAAAGTPLQVGIFAGELTTDRLRLLAQAAAEHGDGFLSLTAEQDLLISPADGAAMTPLEQAVAAIGLGGSDRTARVAFRICPGNHECRLGLAPTRDIARTVLDTMPSAGEQLVWAISGCPNSCSQPQLADWGIVTSRLGRDAAGDQKPLFDLYRRTGPGLGTVVKEGLDLEQVKTFVAEIRL